MLTTGESLHPHELPRVLSCKMEIATWHPGALPQPWGDQHPQQPSCRGRLKYGDPDQETAEAETHSRSVAQEPGLCPSARLAHPLKALCVVKAESAWLTSRAWVTCGSGMFDRWGGWLPWGWSFCALSSPRPSPPPPGRPTVSWGDTVGKTRGIFLSASGFVKNLFIYLLFSPREQLGLQNVVTGVT